MRDADYAAAGKLWIDRNARRGMAPNDCRGGEALPDVSSHAPVWMAASSADSVALTVPSHPAFERVLAQMPLAVRGSFTVDQLTALARATLPTVVRHPLDYRVSIGVFGRRYYLTILGGREKRSRERLLREGQLMLSRLTLAYSFLIGAVASFWFIVAIVGLYIIKSLLGIDIMDGQSPLHGIYMAIEP